MDSARWRAEYQQQVLSDGIDDHAFELWCWYYEETEAFDRTVCTGPIVHGGIMPATSEERRLINENARHLSNQVALWVAGLGVSYERSKTLCNAACDRKRR